MGRWISRAPFFDGPLDRNKKKWIMTIVFVVIIASQWTNIPLFNLDKVIFSGVTVGKIVSVLLAWFILLIHNQLRGF